MNLRLLFDSLENGHDETHYNRLTRPATGLSAEPFAYDYQSFRLWNRLGKA